MRIGIAVGVALACAGCSRILGFEELGTGDDASIAPPMDMATVDVLADTPVVKLESKFVTAATTDVNGTDVAVGVPQPIPADRFLVVEVAARGAPPVTVTDTKGHTWIKDAEITNSTNTSVVAIFHVRTTSVLDEDTITARLGTGASNERGLALFELDGATVLDQIGTAQDSTMMPTVSTNGPIGGSVLAFGVVVTGFNNPVTFAPQQGFVEATAFATPLSSASFDHALVEAGAGQPLSFATAASSTANFGLAIATYR